MPFHPAGFILAISEKNVVSPGRWIREYDDVFAADEVLLWFRFLVWVFMRVSSCRFKFEFPSLIWVHDDLPCIDAASCCHAQRRGENVMVVYNGQGGCWLCSVTQCIRLRSHTWGWFCKSLNYWDVFLGDISFYLVLVFASSFSSRLYPDDRKCTDYCGMNMSTNMALKTRTRCYAFDQSVRKCNDSSVVNMLTKIAIYSRTESYLLLLLLCVKHHAHHNSKIF